MVELAQLIVGGLSTGTLYGLVALGIVLLYRSSRVLNFAHGDLATLAAFVAFTLLLRVQPPGLLPGQARVRWDAFLPAAAGSLLVAALTIALSVAIGAPAGYALSRFRFPGREAFRLGILATKMFPATILAVPLAVAFIRWGLYDTLWGVAFVHTALALPFTIIITMSVFLGVPLELEEAAMTLGCSRLQAFRRVALPIALPGLAAAAIFTFVLSWNEVFAATILTLRNRTLPALVMNAVGAAGAPLDYRFAAGFFMIVPALIIILLIRRYLLTLWGVTVR